MSIATEIQRLASARDLIREKLVELGLATSTAKLEVLANSVDDIENIGAVTASVKEGDTYTIPRGYHNGSGTVSGVAGGGNYTLQSKEVTPTNSQQVVSPGSGYYGLSGVTVKAIPAAYQNALETVNDIITEASSAATLDPSELLTGRFAYVGDENANAIVKVEGSMPNHGAIEGEIDGLTTTSYAIPQGYHDGSGTVSLTNDIETALAAI